ncbi:ATP-binding protein [Kineococcus sp. R86509]|uniref:ATP-binding protein n=1 Tax=Kineococcus sp. R86509 TaxID=3093851 RepID=UPI0036D2EB94
MCTITPSAKVILPLDSHAPKVARNFLTQALCVAHHAGVRDEAELLVSELITNGVRYGAAPLVMQLICEGPAGLRISVSDAGPGEPAPRQAGIDDESGRGMTLVDVLSKEWGVEASEAGKTVWCCLAS